MIDADDEIVIADPEDALVQLVDRIDGLLLTLVKDHWLVIPDSDIEWIKAHRENYLRLFADILRDLDSTQVAERLEDLGGRWVPAS